MVNAAARVLAADDVFRRISAILGLRISELATYMPVVESLGVESLGVESLGLRISDLVSYMPVL